jgi:predicted TIM-barrel fold metal-dependent hydrolase
MVNCVSSRPRPLPFKLDYCSVIFPIIMLIYFFLLSSRKDIQRFYVDTALSTSQSQLMALTAVIPSDHILYGSDWPYVSQSASHSGIKDLESFIHGGCCCGGFGRPVDSQSTTEPSHGREELAGIWYDNTQKLFHWGKYASG